MADAADKFERELQRRGGRPLPSKRSSIALVEDKPEMPRPETLRHLTTPLTEEERAIAYDLLFR